MATTKKLLTVSTFPSSSTTTTTTMKTNCQTELEFQSPEPPTITSSLMMMMMINNVWPKWSSSSSSSTTLQSINYGNYRIVMSIIFILQILFINHHIDSCSCLPTSSLPKSSSTSSLTDNQMMINDDDINYPIITNNKLATIRFVRSYSEEFMSSSEERERGLQFFGGTSAGSSVALSSSTTALLSSSQSSSSSAQKRISPYFDTESISTNVTISEGSAFVHLPCRVKQLGDRTLSWIRRQDFQILTVGTFTYTSDQRFQAIHRENSDDWSLQISYPRKKDAGIYECQISTMPKMSLFIQLNVVVSRAKIVEGPTLYLSSGSTLNLTCMVKDTPEPPDYIFWYYNGQVINYGSPRGIKVHTEKSAQTISKLIILKAQANDSGNYSCTPSNAEPAHIAVHVQNNANPAASIQHGKRSASREYNNGNGCQQLYRSSFILTILTSLIMALFL
uniref:Uncharacterized protein LOC113791052 n=1 Tax=Dermatophagoides pteronyssinus TaxID=6956 RepID=A0A6P6XT05_DERPT|nr:uncharacterized protein LOC113791052 [Dermatophagoides pteronyssinus]